MSLLPQDEHHLQRALELAQQAVGLASPNPTVGCVLVRDGEVLGEGAHHYAERDHAEIAALKQASSRGHDAQQATAYVTLEPCSHHGRTGPCSDALIAAGIARCVVATVDPNPLVRGGGLTKLRAAGVEVVVADPASALTQQARYLNDAFAHWIQHRRPLVTLKAAVSVDGRLAPAPQHRTANQPHWLTGEAARADVQQLRHASDAILTGIGTVLADDPSLTDRSGLPRRRPLLRVVLDSSLRMPIDSQLVRSADNDLLLLCSATAPTDRESELHNRGVEIIRLHGNEGRLDLRAALDFLAQRNIISVFVEGGSSLNGSLLREGLADKLVLYYAESELGVEAIPFAEGIASPYVVQQQLQHTERASFPHGTAEDIRIIGYLHDPWTGI
jgi:diaminohydroxyphosphoribosylaminopyrimidine deaminase / 5-amino-6-(5-phosphoribosylamino)uracil reductase